MDLEIVIPTQQDSPFLRHNLLHKAVVRLRPATWHTVNIRNQAVPNMDTEGLEVTIEALNLLEPRCALVPDKWQDHLGAVVAPDCRRKTEPP